MKTGISSPTHAGNGRPRAEARGDILRREFTALAVKVRRELGQHTPSAAVVGVIAANPRAGSTTVACELARQLARVSHAGILLADGDFQQATLSARCGHPVASGLCDIMLGNIDEQEALWPLSEPGLHLVAAGSPSARGKVDLESGTFESTIRGLKAEFGTVVVDLPSLAETDDGLAMSAELDGVLFVVEAERTNVREARKCVDQLRTTQVPLLGLVFNKERCHVPHWLAKRI